MSIKITEKLAFKANLGLLPVGTKVVPIMKIPAKRLKNGRFGKARRSGIIADYNLRFADKVMKPRDFPYIIHWDDGTRDVYAKGAFGVNL